MVNERTQEQRKFQRVRFYNTATFSLKGEVLQLMLEDLSLRGARCNTLQNSQISPGSCGELGIELTDGAVITMAVSVDYVEADCIGLHWTEIDVDSLTLLRRLMELNYGDADEIGRELSALEDH